MSVPIHAIRSNVYCPTMNVENNNLRQQCIEICFAIRSSDKNDGKYVCALLELKY